MFYHASRTRGIEILCPHVSNHERPLIYFFTRRSDTLVYLSNAVEKYCRQVNFPHSGPYKKWGSYGFTGEGILRLEEYYPNATADTYKGESGYIYSVEFIERFVALKDIPRAVATDGEAAVSACEYIADAYGEILNAADRGEIILQRYEENSPAMLGWIEKSIKSEYQNAVQHPEYRAFLLAKFSFLSDRLTQAEMDV